MEFGANECSWNKVRKKGDITVCSSPDVIKKMADFLETLGEKVDASKLDQADVKSEIVEKMKEKTKCESESCAIQNPKFKKFASPYVVEKNLEENFKTKGPANTTEWLSNFNIDDVLEEIKKTYADQHFWNIPFQMRDFKKTKPDENADEKQKESNLESFDILKKYKENYRCFGVAINTDYSSGNGIHWFCLFICMRNPDITIEYFNSSGNPPLAEIASWMKKTRMLLTNAFPNRKVYEVIASKEEHQTDDHSCGVYALYYIISRVANIPYTYFQKNIVKDETMHKFRKFIFRSDK